MGDENNRESNRSKIPPWPGIKFDESLTPASRFRSDSVRSPIWPNVPMINPITIASLSDKKSRTIFFANIIARIANTNPKIAPSQLFLGLMR
jgi:hypothetical protein